MLRISDFDMNKGWGIARWREKRRNREGEPYPCTDDRAWPTELARNIWEFIPAREPAHPNVNLMLSA